MSNWFLKCAAAGIVVISYADTIAGIVQYEHIGSFLWILSIVIIIIAIASHKNKERIKKIQVIDLASTIYVIMRANEKYHFKLEFQPAQNYMNVYSIRFAGIVQSVVYNLVAVFAVAIVLNAVLSSYGWGLTRLVKTAYYRIFYSTLYCLLRNKLCYALFRKYAIGKKILSEAECELFRRAVEKRKKYIKNNNIGRFYYPIVFRHHAEKKSFMPKWLYNISLVQGNKIHLDCIGPAQTSRKAEFTVDLTDANLAIINNSGKKFLRDFYSEDANSRETITRHNKTINYFLSDKNTEKTTVEFHDASFYRWGSAGALPIINWKGTKWIAFVYRDIYPKGWNLPLGASECELEKGRPGITAIRETFEELIVLKEKIKEYVEYEGMEFPVRKELYHPLLNSIEGEVNFQATKRRFYEKQEEIISHTCQIKFNNEATGYNSLECSDNRTTIRIKVNDENRKVILPKNVSTNCLITVDNYEQGIECVKPIRFSMDDDNELRMGEVDLLENKWINNPVILVKYSVLEEYFNNDPEFNESLKSEELYSEKDKVFGEGLSLKSILSKPENYHLFGVNMKDREQYQQFLDKELRKCNKVIYRKKYQNLQAQKEYLSQFVDRNQDFFAEDDGTDTTTIADLGAKANPAYYLCPAAWKTCYYFLRNIYKGEVIESAGE